MCLFENLEADYEENDTCLAVGNTDIRVIANRLFWTGISISTNANTSTNTYLSVTFLL